MKDTVLLPRSFDLGYSVTKWKESNVTSAITQLKALKQLKRMIDDVMPSGQSVPPQTLAAINKLIAMRYQLITQEVSDLSSVEIVDDEVKLVLDKLVTDL